MFYIPCVMQITVERKKSKRAYKSIKTIKKQWKKKAKRRAENEKE